MDIRPVLLAMCNPYSDDPQYALWPSPVGCSGWRLWNLLHRRTGATKDQYVDAFDRRNLLGTRDWDAARGRGAAAVVAEGLRGREVVVLGAEVRDALQLPPLLIHPQESWGATWRQLPHPSGRCRWYNYEDNRLLAGMLLQALYERTSP